MVCNIGELRSAADTPTLPLLPLPPRRANVDGRGAAQTDAALCRLLMTLYEMQYLAPERPRSDELMRRLSTAYQSLLAFRRTDGGFALYR